MTTNTSTEVGIILFRITRVLAMKQSTWEKRWAALEQPRELPSRLGLYLHIPFCRKRCKFCYFKVYTDKNANEIEIYLDAADQRKWNATAACLLCRDGRCALLIWRRHSSYISERQLR